jgi:hypothetical protein
VSGADAYIGSIAVDPADGTVMLGTGLGLFRLAKGEKDAERVTGELATPEGSGRVSSNLVGLRQQQVVLRRPPARRDLDVGRGDVTAARA